MKYNFLLIFIFINSFIYSFNGIEINLSYQFLNYSDLNKSIENFANDFVSEGYYAKIEEAQSVAGLKINFIFTDIKTIKIISNVYFLDSLNLSHTIYKSSDKKEKYAEYKDSIINGYVGFGARKEIININNFSFYIEGDIGPWIFLENVYFKNYDSLKEQKENATSIFFGFSGNIGVRYTITNNLYVFLNSGYHKIGENFQISLGTGYNFESKIKKINYEYEKKYKYYIFYGDKYLKIKKYKKALKYYYEALKYKKTYKVYIRIGYIFYIFNNKKYALYYYNEALKIKDNKALRKWIKKNLK